MRRTTHSGPDRIGSYAVNVGRVLITGMSGAGKSTVLAVLAHRGYRTVDTDYDGWHVTETHWDEPRMTALLTTYSTIAVCGTAENQGLFYDWFDHIVYLKAPLPLLLDRVRSRSDNPYGKTAQQQADIARYLRQVEPLIRSGATLELDAREPIEALADSIERCLLTSS